MSPKRRRLDFPGRAGFCISGIWKKGSFTVEAAFALPLFFLTVLSLIGLMGIYGSYAHTMVSLQQQAESQALLQIYRQEESTVPVRLRETVKADLSLLPFQAGTAQAVVMAQVLPWTGRADYSSLAAADSDSGKLYYLSDHQSVYHTSSSCTYLSLQISAMEAGRLSRAKNGHGERYHACEKCVGAGGTAAVVYVTPNGEHFHNSADCSGLKRSVHLVEESDIAGLHLCSRCSRREAAQ
ncbi:MAG: hypothetical protein Q4B03_02860 [Lachnospiraceae bacterium]|nr:hypothetical protein [Lachnospiraceae bacterium]